MIGSPLFGLIYKNTVETLPQAFLIVLAGFFLVDWLILLYINFGVRKIAKKMSAAVEMKELDPAAKEELLEKK